MTIQAVEHRQDYPGIIRVTEDAHSYVDYLREDNGIMIPGYVYIMTYQPGFSVHLFMPYDRNDRPVLLSIQDNRTPGDPKDLRNAVLPAFTPAS